MQYIGTPRADNIKGKRMASKKNVLGQKKKDKKYIIAISVYTLILVILSVSALAYVGSLLREYEAKQPDTVAGAALNTLQGNVMRGKARDSFSFDEMGNAKFDPDADIYEDYLASLDGKTLSIKPGGKSYSGETLTYDVLADTEKVATMVLESGKTETKLIVFTMSDWHVTKIIPAITVTTYSYYIKVPTSFSVSANGIKLGNEEFAGSENGTRAYELKDLISEPEFEITDADGNKAYYNIVNDPNMKMNVVTPVLYEYTVSLPSNYTLSVNGKAAEPASVTDGTSRYEITRAAKPEFTVGDGYGGSVTVMAGSEIKTYPHTVTVPMGYTVSLGGRTLTGGRLIDDPAEKYVSELGISLPQQTEYTLSLLTETAAFTVTDENGVPAAASEKDGILTVGRKKSGANMPADLAAEVDPMKIAETWSKFLTDDLTGEYYGFYEVTQYFKKDSYMYSMALAWINSENPLIVSGHILGDFEGERVTNYTRYADNCFSVDVHLTKVMYLDSGKTERDEMNSTFYFVNDGKWYLVCMIDITD